MIPNQIAVTKCIIISWVCVPSTKVVGFLSMAATTFSNANLAWITCKVFLQDERHTFSSRQEAIILSEMILI